MCGIWALLSPRPIKEEDLLDDYKKIVHRGPDCSCFHHLSGKVSTDKEQHQHLVFGFHRLAIIDPSCQSDQPLFSNDGSCALICNGEIFNYHELIRDLEHSAQLTMKTKSDCEPILGLYQTRGLLETVRGLKAEFAFVIYDKEKRQVHLARDRFGVRPLFWCVTDDNDLFISSEAKAIPQLSSEGDQLNKVEPFPPGHTVTVQFTPNGYEIGDPVPFITWPKEPVSSDDLPSIKLKIRELLTTSVQRRLMSDRPLGCLLSGGLDSSLVTSLVWKELNESQRDHFHCFSIGLEGSVDLQAAKMVAEFLGIRHHHIIKFTVEEGLEALREVIYHLETYDVTTIRASVPQYLLAKYVGTQTDIRVLLSGEGADELFAGYQYFKRCPDPESLRQESRRLLDQLYLFDNLRTDRTTAAWGLEVRVPFLDRELVEYVDTLPPGFRMCDSGRMEKTILREAFEGDYLPDAILWRRKEAFSDAVSSRETSWYKTLQGHLIEKVLKVGPSNEKKSLDALLESRQKEYPNNPPPTLEALAYRTIFEELHPGRSNLIPHYWMPRWVTLESWDPSATKLDCHEGDLRGASRSP